MISLFCDSFLISPAFIEPFHFSFSYCSKALFRRTYVIFQCDDRVACSCRMLLEFGSFDFLFFKDQDHTIILSFLFLCDNEYVKAAISLQQLQLPFSFIFLLTMHSHAFLKNRQSPDKKIPTPVGRHCRWFPMRKPGAK